VRDCVSAHGLPGVWYPAGGSTRLCIISRSALAAVLRLCCDEEGVHDFSDGGRDGTGRGARSQPGNASIAMRARRPDPNVNRYWRRGFIVAPGPRAECPRHHGHSGGGQPGQCRKFENLHGARYVDYMDKRELRRAIGENALGSGRIEAILHQGACSNTLEDDGAYMMDNNFQYTKEVLRFAMEQGVPLVFASARGLWALRAGTLYAELENERPLNVYGFSKLAFDHYLRNRLALDEVPTTAVGCATSMCMAEGAAQGTHASVIHHFTKQMKETGKVRLFAGSGGYGDGEQRRDFVYVRDLARMNMFFAGIGPTRPRPARSARSIAAW